MVCLLFVRHFFPHLYVVPLPPSFLLLLLLLSPLTALVLNLLFFPPTARFDNCPRPNADLRRPERPLLSGVSSNVFSNASVTGTAHLMPKGVDGVNVAGSLISSDPGMMVILVSPRPAPRVSNT